MHPELFKIPIPEFLQGFLPAELTIYSYGLFIALGALGGFLYTHRQANRQFGTPMETISNLILLIIVASVVGGKVFFYFEDPSYYFGKPSRMLENFGNGFVFFGSLIFSIGAMLWFFKKNKLPILKMLDIMAITACIVHALGRLGCFSAGCCHGLPYDGIFSVVFTDPLCKAPLNTGLHPTQLYSMALILGVLVILLLVKRRKQFDGQLFTLYIILYSIGRSVIEIFRGDLRRGFIIEDYLSHSQFISIIMIAIALYFYRKLKMKGLSK